MKINEFMNNMGLIFINILMIFAFFAGFSGAVQQMDIQQLDSIWIMIMLLCIIVIDLEKIWINMVEKQECNTDDLIKESINFVL